MGLSLLIGLKRITDMKLILVTLDLNALVPNGGTKRTGLWHIDTNREGI